MVMTNRASLPAAFAVAIENIRAAHTPSGADATVTELVGSPRIGALRRAHKHEIVEDVADNVWSLWGTAIHMILEQAGRDLPDTLTEHMLWTEVRGWDVCGVLDTHCLIDARLDDYKATSWFAIKDGGKGDWTAQLNVLRLLLVDAGHPVRELGIVPLIRDHRASEAKRYASEGYPPEPVTRLPVELWPLDQTRAYLDERVRLHQLARQSLQAGSLAHCTREERWQRDPKWAVMRAGKERALKLCNSQAEADEVIAGADLRTSQLSVVYRPGIAVRCGKYCSVKPWCLGLADGQFQEGDLEVSDDA